MTDREIQFYRRREQQERAIAARSASAPIAAIHARMATRYAALAHPSFEDGTSPAQPAA